MVIINEYNKIGVMITNKYHFFDFYRQSTPHQLRVCAYAGSDLGVVGSQATVIVGPQPPHTPTVSISCYFIKRIQRYRYYPAFLYKFGGPLCPGPQALLLLLLCKSPLRLR